MVPNEKAGKVRWASNDGKPKFIGHRPHKKKPFPRLRNRRNFEKRELLHRKGGQNAPPSASRW